MKAAVWTKIGKIEIKEVPMPVIGDDEVLLKVRAAGVCVTDIHVYSGRFVYGDPPHILGHEFCGEIVEMGKNVKGFSLGQRVVAETTMGCGHCEHCRTGNAHLCKDTEEIGTKPHTGAYAQYLKAPARNLFPLPDSISDEEAAIMESVNCPTGALMRWGVHMGETVVVYGVGPAGLAFIQAAKALGAGKVIAVARNRKRLERSMKFGADQIVCTTECNAEEKILELTGGEGPSLICESTGVPSIIEEACRVARAGGRIILYGLPSEGADIQFPVKTMIMKQLEVYGTLGSLLSWEHLIKLVDGGRINLKDMVTHTLPLDRIEEAFALVEDKTQDPIKVVLYPWA